eukprot:SAG22_NODE_376_length_11537_cov_29.420353_4_plen_53_part_00
MNLHMNFIYELNRIHMNPPVFVRKGVHYTSIGPIELIELIEPIESIEPKNLI